jgi:FkbM family methyltransferase
MGSSHRTKNVLYFVARYCLQRKFLVARAPEFDLRLRFRVEDAVGRRIFKRGSYETDLTAYLTRRLACEDGSVLLDVGANIGWHSLTLARTTRARVSIVAFEPDPLSFRLLTHNIHLNGCDVIHAVQAAVSDCDSTKTLYLYANKNRGRHSLLPINAAGTVEVRTMSLDAFLEREGIAPQRVAFMKVDVEGYEYHVLNGARRLLDTVPLLLCEYSPGYMKRGGIDPGALVSLLREKHYVPHALRDGELQPVTFTDLATIETNDVNFFWVKRPPPRETGRHARPAAPDPAAGYGECSRHQAASAG